jgi:hypothetical protein
VIRGERSGRPEEGDRLGGDLAQRLLDQGGAGILDALVQK